MGVYGYVVSIRQNGGTTNVSCMWVAAHPYLPDKKVYSGEVTSVSVPGSTGRFEMLQNHAPIISTLLNGKVKIKDKEGVKDIEKREKNRRLSEGLRVQN